MPSTLSADTKDALARDLPDTPHCRSALLTGLILYAGGDNVFVTRRNAIARLFRTLAKEQGHDTAHVSGRDARRTSSLRAVVPAELRGAAAKPARRCDRFMELRGAFLACGSLATAMHGYHLEFVPNSSANANRLALLLRSVGRDPKQMLRKGRIVLYYKDFDAIADVLTAIGGFSAVLRLEDDRALRETKNRIHRLVNTEAANLERAVSAAATHVRTIAFLANAYGLQNLSPALREIAQARLAHPEESLAELGRRCDPPIGKPTVNSRLTALASLERRLRGGRATARGKVGRRSR